MNLVSNKEKKGYRKTYFFDTLEIILLERFMATPPITAGSLSPSSQAGEAVLWKLFSCACFAGINVFVRKLTKSSGGDFEPLSVYMVLFLQHVFAFLILLPYLLTKSKLHYLRTDKPLLQFVRVITAIAGLLLWYKGISYLPLAEAQSIQHFSPLLLFIGGVFVLKEKLSRQKIITLSLGLLGMLLIAKPYEVWLTGGVVTREFALTLTGMGFVLASVFTLTVAKILIKKLTREIKPFELTTFMLGYMPLVALVPAVIAGDWPVWAHMPYLLAAGILTLGAHYGITQAFRLADISLISPVAYSKMLFSIILGYLLLGELPTEPDKWVGMLLIIGSGLAAGAGYKSK